MSKHMSSRDQLISQFIAGCITSVLVFIGLLIVTLGFDIDVPILLAALVGLIIGILSGQISRQLHKTRGWRR